MDVVLEERTDAWITRWLVAPPADEIGFKVPAGGDSWEYTDGQLPIRYISRYEDEHGIWHDAANPNTGAPPSWGF